MAKELCHVCGGEAVLVKEPREFKVGRRSAKIVDAFMRCGDCSEEYYLPGQMDAAQIKASEAIRREEGLLMPNEIVAIRESFDLSQAEFERLLGVGSKTVIRWEKGTVFQNKATDALLRLLRADRDNARRLSQWNNVPLSLPPLQGRETERAHIAGRVTYEAPPAHGRAVGDRSEQAKFWAGTRPLVIALDSDDLTRTGEPNER